LALESSAVHAHDTFIESPRIREDDIRFCASVGKFEPGLASAGCVH